MKEWKITAAIIGSVMLWATAIMLKDWVHHLLEMERIEYEYKILQKPPKCPRQSISL